MAISEQLKKAAIDDFVENAQALGVTSIALKDIHRFAITNPLYVGKVIKGGINLDDATTEDFEEVVVEASGVLAKSGVFFAVGDVAIHELAKRYLTAIRAVNNYERLRRVL